MRQHDMEMPFDETVEPKFEEMHYLEKSIGRTGLLAIDFSRFLVSRSSYRIRLNIHTILAKLNHHLAELNRLRFH